MKNIHNRPLTTFGLEFEDVEAFTGALTSFWGQSDEEWAAWRREREIEDEQGAKLVQYQREIGRISLCTEYTIDTESDTYVPLAS